MDVIGKLHFTVYYTRKNIDLSKCKLQKEEVAWSAMVQNRRITEPR